MSIFRLNLKGSVKFKTYRETLRRSINEAKKMYYQKVFGLYRNDMKKNLANY